MKHTTPKHTEFMSNACICRLPVDKTDICKIHNIFLHKWSHNWRKTCKTSNQTGKKLVQKEFGRYKQARTVYLPWLARFFAFPGRKG